MLGGRETCGNPEPQPPATSGSQDVPCSSLLRAGDKIKVSHVQPTYRGTLLLLVGLPLFLENSASQEIAKGISQTD
jgi:hypothetical protein